MENIFLEHPNVKAFITHGGQLGILESVSYAVPMICLPLYIDQMTNAAKLDEKKVAINLNVHSLSSSDFGRALREILHNPIYRLRYFLVLRKFNTKGNNF